MQDFGGLVHGTERAKRLGPGPRELLVWVSPNMHLGSIDFLEGITSVEHHDVGIPSSRSIVCCWHLTAIEQVDWSQCPMDLQE